MLRILYGPLPATSKSSMKLSRVSSKHTAHCTFPALSRCVAYQHHHYQDALASCGIRSVSVFKSKYTSTCRTRISPGSGVQNYSMVQLELNYEDELDDQFTGLAGDDGLMTIAGFGSLLSERSARYTFPDLVNFRPGLVHGWRRVFAHTADVFFARGIAKPDTREIASLSLERLDAAASTPASPHGSSAQGTTGSEAGGAEVAEAAAAGAAAPVNGGVHGAGSCVVVSLFEVPATPASVAAFIAREHEFRFVAVRPTDLAGRPVGRRAVICARNTDADYRALRCPPSEWAARWGPYGITSVWRDDVLPCRTYLRHCILAARSLGPQAEESFLHGTFLADRTTTIAQHLAAHPGIMDELPPPELAARYNG